MLLRLGELDRLHDWTHNLAELVPVAPDGLAPWGEHQARLGPAWRGADVVPAAT